MSNNNFKEQVEKALRNTGDGSKSINKNDVTLKTSKPTTYDNKKIELKVGKTIYEENENSSKGSN